ncbi:phytoene desaturase family protein [Tumebacillus permanentifrigoris]|uniref:Phytoene dehydrogenase-like protein n=1 Tax=Tumebacillus permanentifrigoris TaxID=378543 RepID=A0A316E191_9BACL|nr:FAD-dependent oxidoreductase [Tumebacillus permanentifrigoris]PWK16580.1 phytoene dehydrogenase-like protein [Tumebacillus permanentifrigoris]
MEKKKWDITIIGAGLAGLTAAVYLAQAGKQVLLLEHGSRLGGRAATDEQNGCFLNIGPHAVYKNGAGLQILHELGVAPSAGELKLGGRLVTEEKIHDLPLTAFGLLKSGCFSFKEKAELARLLTKISKLNPQSVEHLTLQEWLHGAVKGKNARNFFLALARLSTYSNSPMQISAGTVLRQYQLSLGGVYYVHEGWQTVVNALGERAAQVGANVQTGKKVTAIRGTHPEMTVQLADGTEIATRNVLSTASPSKTFELADAKPTSQLGVLCDRVTPVYGAALDVALRRLPNPGTNFALHLERPYYFSNHSHTARLTQNRNHVVLHIFKYLSAQEETSAKRNRQELESFLDQLQPGWRNELITSRYLPRIAVTNGLPTVERVRNARQTEVPETVVSDCPGLYLAGDWVVNESLLADAAYVSGKEIATHILRTEMSHLSLATGARC